MEEKKHVKRTLNPLPRIINNIFVTTAEKNRRLAICEKCPHIGTFLNQINCKVCGCFLEAKTALKDQHCPLEQRKW